MRGLHLQEMLVDIARNQDQAQLTAEHLEAGLKLVINSLDKTYADGPFAPKLVSPVADLATRYSWSSSFGCIEVDAPGHSLASWTI